MDPLQQRVTLMKGYGSGYLVGWPGSNPFHRRTGDLRTGRARTGPAFSPTKKGWVYTLPETHGSPLKIGELEDPFFRGRTVSFWEGTWRTIILRKWLVEGLTVQPFITRLIILRGRRLTIGIFHLLTG